MLNKDCPKCVYHEYVTLYPNAAQPTQVCRCISGREHNKEIKDCYIPEAPLRKEQALTHTADHFIAVTTNYILRHKRQSEYWTRELKNFVQAE